LLPKAKQTGLPGWKKQRQNDKDQWFEEQIHIEQNRLVEGKNENKQQQTTKLECVPSISCTEETEELWTAFSHLLKTTIGRNELNANKMINYPLPLS
jgi:hypothetical protein